MPKILKVAGQLGVSVGKKVVNAMKNALSLLTIAVFSLAVLLAGCGNSEPGSSSSVQVETSSETISSAEPEASESQPEMIVSEQPQAPASGMASGSQTKDRETMEEHSEMKMNVQVGGSTFTATLEENLAVNALVEMMERRPVTIQMRDYSGFEKVGPLGTNLPTSNSQSTTHAGDIVLYQGNQIVMFYGSNTWSYTRLGRIDNLTGWEKALGSGDVTVTLSLGD